MTQPHATFDDNTLIKLALAGQGECFAVLMNRHMVAIKRCIGSMVGNATDADDVLQEVLLKVWRRLSTFRSESSFRTWTTRVATNEALQSFRRERRGPLFHSLADLATLASGCESPHQSFARAEVTRAVRSAVVQLPEKYRQVLILRDLEELSVREAAQWLRLSIPAVKARLFRARLMLVAALGRSRIRGLEARNVRVAFPGGSVRRDDIRTRF